MKTYFIAGTDTDVGKTLATCALLHKVRQGGRTCIGLKPVAAGCEETPDGLQNEDAVAIIEAMSESLPYQQVNPVALPEPMSPHLAAERAGRRPTVAQLEGLTRGALMKKADFAFIEGAGGWRVPLNDRESISDLAKTLDKPVILVVGMRLGCLNHALLTAEAIRHDGLEIVGWIANQLDPNMLAYNENLATLKRLLPAPCLGHIPRLSAPAAPELAADYLDISVLAD